MPWGMASPLVRTPPYKLELFGKVTTLTRGTVGSVGRTAGRRLSPFPHLFLTLTLSPTLALTLTLTLFEGLVVDGVSSVVLGPLLAAWVYVDPLSMPSLVIWAYQVRLQEPD